MRTFCLFLVLVTVSHVADGQGSGDATRGKESLYAGRSASEWIALTKSKRSEVREDAAWALGRISADSKTTVPVLIGLLKDKDLSVKSHAALALGEIGPEAKTAIPALTEWLEDKDSRRREDAVRALGGIGPEAIPALLKALRDGDKSVRYAAVEALGNMGPQAKSAVPALLDLNKSKETWAHPIIRAILKIEPERLKPDSAGGTESRNK